MNVLVTGSQGGLGQVLAPSLRNRGHDVTPFDLVLGDDVRTLDLITSAVLGVDAIVHMAAVGWDARWESAVTTNVHGCHNVLAAAVKQSVTRIVNVSSLQATGTMMGSRAPTRFPIDERQPCVPDTPYGASKLIAEQLCDRYSSVEPNLEIVSLRLPAVWFAERYARERQKWATDETRQWKPFWEYGVFIDIGDVVDVVDRALTADVKGHHVLNAAAADSAALWPTLKLVERLHPDVPWRSVADREQFELDPFRSLIDTSEAGRVLGWTATKTFSAESASSE